MKKLYNSTKNTVLAHRLYEARSFFQRLVGLLGRSPLQPGEALLLEPCCCIHTFFMDYPLDVLFYDKEKRVVAIFAEMPPWRCTPLVRRARGAIEFPPGTLEAAGTGVGDRLKW